MNDLETHLRATLRSHLDEVRTAGGLPNDVRRRAKRGRLIALAATGLVTVIALTSGVVGTTSVLRDDDARDDIAIAPPTASGSWQPVGPTQFQPVRGGSRGVTRVGVNLAWEGPIEAARPTRCDVEVLGNAGVVGTANATIPPPEKEEFEGGAVPGHELNVPVRVPPKEMGSNSRVSCGPIARGQRSTSDPRFLPKTGWNVASTADTDSFVNPTAWAWNADFDVKFPEHPTDLLRTMNETELFIAVELPMPERWPAPPTDEFPTGHLPLSTSDADIHRSWEGQPADEVVMYRISRTIEGMYVDARVYFATQEPSSETLRQADGQLSRLILPQRGRACVGDGYCLSRTSAPAGARVEVTGPARGRTKDGSPVRTKRVEVWWSLEPKEWTRVVVEGDRDEEDPSRIATRNVRQGARFALDFEVPRAESGTYPLVLIVYGGGGGASPVPFEFVVTE